MPQTKQPNIIFLMTDQHRFDALGCANPLVKTPNLDRLCASGIRFTDAVCNAPMCIPSRYSMMTGLYPSQCGVRHNTDMCATDDELPITVLPQRLKNLGYQTAGFGKTHWYLGSLNNCDLKAQTSLRGFEDYYSAWQIDPNANAPGEMIMQRMDPEAYKHMDAEAAPFGVGGESVEGYLGITSQLDIRETREGWVTQEALQWLDTGRDPERPLMYYLSFDFPHAPFNVPAEYEAMYDLADIPDQPMPPWETHPVGHVPRDAWRGDSWCKLSNEQRRRTTLRYYALCTFVDALFGRVLDKLEAMGELDDALILFTSDHGEMLGQRQHRFSKYCLYEGSVRVPMVLSGSRVPQSLRGTLDNRPAELIDVLPTLNQVAGGQPLPTLPGRSLFDPPHRIASFCEMHGSGYEPAEQGPSLMWRTAAWKLILHQPGGIAEAESRINECIGELYHLTEDPQEWHNRYDDPDCRDTRETMTRQLLMHLACAWSRFPRKTSIRNIGL